MSRVWVELDDAGVKELLKSAEITATCEDYARQVQARAGAGYSVNSRPGRNRVWVRVEAETEEAKRDNLKNNTLLKALGG